ncbi:MAG: RDD family protein [Salinimicrobium sp.]
MDNFQIETAQNISISQNAAGVGERILAYLIDGLIIIAYAIIIIYIIGSLNLSGGQEWMYVLVIGLPIFMYFLLWEIFWNGRTPGKAALDLRVVKLDGSKPAFSNFIVRWLLRVIDITISSGSVAVVTILINGKGQRLGDLAAGTTVISEKMKTSLNNTILEDLPVDYQPVYSQVTVLSDGDVQDIKDIYYEALKNGNYRVIHYLSEKVSKLLEVKPQEKGVEFIKNVLRDYSYFTQQ